MQRSLRRTPGRFVVLAVAWAALASSRVASAEPTAGMTEEPSPSPRRTAGVALAAGRGAATVLGGVFGIIALSKLDDLRQLCGDYPRCPSDVGKAAREGNEAGRTAALATSIFLPVGLLALGAGLVLWLTAPREPPRALSALDRPLTLRF